jgi:pimeloyl-ACP methyl ester carboxylesterase
VEIRDTRYAKTSDGVYIAYQTNGDGPIDVAFQLDWFGNVDVIWEAPLFGRLFTALSRSSRLILHDRRATGLSSRNVPVPNLETRVADLVRVLDAVGSDRPVLCGAREGGSPNALLAATDPERIRSDHHALVRDALARYRGVENDTAGDGFYATFDGPARAIRCALEVRDRVRNLGVEIRAGVHTGECEVIDGKIGGIAVTIGARIAATTGASEVRISQTVKDLVAGSGLTFEDAGEHELKGVPDRWRLYRVVSAA